MEKKLSVNQNLINEFCNACYLYHDTQEAFVNAQLDKNIGPLLMTLQDVKIRDGLNLLFDKAKKSDDEDHIKNAVDLIFRAVNLQLNEMLMAIQHFLLLHKLGSININEQEDLVLTPTEYFHTVNKRGSKPEVNTYTNYHICITFYPKDTSDTESTFVVNMNIPLFVCNERLPDIKSAVIARPTDEAGDVSVEAIYVADDTSDEEKLDLQERIKSISKQVAKKRKRKVSDDDNDDGYEPGGLA